MDAQWNGFGASPDYIVRVVCRCRHRNETIVHRCYRSFLFNTWRGEEVYIKNYSHFSTKEHVNMVGRLRHGHGGGWIHFDVMYGE